MTWHPCFNPLCHKLVEWPERYCPEHKATTIYKPGQRTEKDKERDRRYNLQRYSDENKQYTKFYKSAAWRKVSHLIKLRDQGLCQQCLKEGLVRPGKIVDHIQPLRSSYGWQHRLDETNLWYLCQSCHNKKSKIEKQEREQNGN